MSWSVNWLIAACLFPSVHLMKEDSSRQCQRWGRVASNSTVSEPGLKMSCHRNSTCTGISCSGIYTYTIAQFARTDVDFCFGFRLNPCFTPVSADILVQVPDKSVSYVLQVHSSDNYQIPGLTYKLVGNIIKADVFLDVTMGNVVNGYISFGVDLNVRADYAFGQSWPEGLKRSLVPKQNLFVRHCTSSDPAPAQLIPGVCHPMSASTPRPAPTPSHKPGQVTPASQPAQTTAAHKPTITAAPGSGKKCDLAELGACAPNEMCKGGICTCRLENEDASGNCKGYVSSATVPSADQSTSDSQSTTVPSADQSTSDSQSNTTVIASAVVGSVVGILIIIAVAFLVVRWRRARARYANHELLLSNDDNMVM